MSNLYDNPDGSSPESDALVAAQNLAATSQLIDRLYSAGVLSGTGRVAAMNIVNGQLAWWPWVEKALLFLGLALTLSGVVCFFAWNWDALPGLAKLAIVQAGIVGCCVVACQKKIATLPGKAAITGAAVLVGVFLAVFGQVYQTGADAYQLFVGWALLILPWPSGRHPRIGFLEGAILPQRETKVSIFTPWGDHDYVVVDVPEAVWSNLGLTYLAHTHIPTVFDKQGKTLKKLEWNRHADGTLDIERVLPNGIRFGAVVRPKIDHVQMELWLKNGTPALLTDLRVQNCVMLKSASGFNAQTNDNKQSEGPYAIARSANGNRWIITAWEPLHRAWYNDRCPCLHSDPEFPDCKPGQTVRLKGWLSFYEGNDIGSELKRISVSRSE